MLRSRWAFTTNGASSFMPGAPSKSAPTFSPSVSDNPKYIPDDSSGTRDILQPYHHRMDRDKSGDCSGHRPDLVVDAKHQPSICYQQCHYLICEYEDSIDTNLAGYPQALGFTSRREIGLGPLAPQYCLFTVLSWYYSNAICPVD